MTVGPPIELLVYRNNALAFDRYRCFKADDPELQAIHTRWEQSLRRAVEELPDIQFEGVGCLSPFRPGIQREKLELKGLETP